MDRSVEMMNNMCYLDKRTARELQIEESWNDAIEVYRHKIKQEFDENEGEEPKKGCSSWNEKDDSTYGVNVKDETKDLCTSDTGRVIETVRIKGEDVVTAETISSPEEGNRKLHDVCNDVNINLENDAVGTSNSESHQKFPNNITNKKKCGKNRNKSRNDKTSVKCKMCQVAMLKHCPRHKKSNQNDMINSYICPATNNPCNYVTYLEVSMRRHISQCHEDISPNIKLERKMVPNPQQLERLDGQKNKLRSNGQKNKRKESHVMRKDDKVRLHACPIETCKFASKLKRSVKIHVLTHKKDFSAEELVKLRSNSFPTIFVPKDMVASLQQSRPVQSSVHLQKRRKVKRVLKIKFCCGKEYRNYSQMMAHKRRIHRARVKMFNCPVDGCSTSRDSRHDIRSHVFMVHAKNLGAKELENCLLPENITFKEIPNPKYIPLIPVRTELNLNARRLPRFTTQPNFDRAGRLAPITPIMIKPDSCTGELAPIVIEPDSCKRGLGTIVIEPDSGTGVLPNPIIIEPVSNATNQDMHEYRCEQCDKNFKSVIYLRRHDRMLHDPNRRCCPVEGCSFTAIRIFYFKAHLKNHVKQGEISQEKMDDVIDEHTKCK